MDKCLVWAPDDAILLWGKTACEMAWELKRRRILGGRPCFAIGVGLCRTEFPREVRSCWGDHPVPGPASLHAGQELVDFLAGLNGSRVRRLRVLLSGGASSAAWLPPANLKQAAGIAKFERLYRSGLSIHQLNQARSDLCALKKGGTLRWLEKVAPKTRLLVEVVSDVLPWGPEVIGSGPFWDPARPALGRRTHRVLGDNRLWLESISGGLSATIERSGWVADWSAWVSTLSEKLDSASSGFYFWGGEPLIRMPPNISSDSSGGRLTHLAAELLRVHASSFASGRAEAYFLTSDGVDGRSGLSAVGVGIQAGHWAIQRRGRLAIKRAMERFSTAELFRMPNGLGLPAYATGSNVQDLVALRIRK